MRRNSLSMYTVVLCSTASAVAGGDGMLFEQAPAPVSLGLEVASQDFPDDSAFSIIAADDFSVTDDAGWIVESLHSNFTVGNGSGIAPEGIRWMVWTDDGTGQPGDPVINVVSDGFDLTTGNADFFLGDAGDLVELPAGDYWFASQLIGAISVFGQEFHRGSLDGAGSSNFLWNNPGGGFGIPAGWVDANATGLSDVTNLAFGIGGSVIPEPATLTLLAVSSVALLRRRKQFSPRT